MKYMKYNTIQVQKSFYKFIVSIDNVFKSNNKI